MPVSVPEGLREYSSSNQAATAPTAISVSVARPPNHTLLPALMTTISARQKGLPVAATSAVLASGDMVLAGLCTVAAYVLAGGNADGLAICVLLCGACTVAGMHIAGVYNLTESRKTNELALRILMGVLASSALTATVVLAWPAMPLGWPGVARYHLLVVPVFVVWHLWGSRWMRGRFMPATIAVVGHGEAVLEIAQAISSNNFFRLGMVATPSSTGAVLISTKNKSAAPIAVEDLPSIVARHGIESIAVLDSGRKFSDELYRQLWNCRNSGVDVLDPVTCVEVLEGKLPLDHIHGWHTPSMSFPGWDHAFDNKLKRIFDVVLALVGMVVCAPVMLIAATGIRWSDSGPVIYTQKRVGQRGRTFTIYKFRTMMVDAEPDGSEVISHLQDPRPFPFGRFLRNTHLDELPQLWNVLKGDMSMIGPRPERPLAVRTCRRHIPYYDARHVAMPGITGWTQIRWPRCHHHGDLVTQARTKLEYDLYYVRYRNIVWDIHIAAKTVWVILEALWLNLKLKS